MSEGALCEKFPKKESSSPAEDASQCLSASYTLAYVIERERWQNLQATVDVEVRERGERWGFFAASQRAYLKARGIGWTFLREKGVAGEKRRLFVSCRDHVERERERDATRSVNSCCCSPVHFVPLK